jgi:hypothetical protein
VPVASDLEHTDLERVVTIAKSCLGAARGRIAAPALDVHAHFSTLVEEFLYLHPLV